MVWTWVDMVISGIVGLSVFTGLMRGFVKELIALFAWIAAIWCAFQYSSEVSAWLAPYIHDKNIRQAASFAAILLVILLVGSLVNALLSFLLKRAGLSGTDRLLGMGFGFTRGVLIVALIMVVVKFTGLPVEDYRHTSKLYAYFDPLASWMAVKVQPVIAKAAAMEDGFGK